MLLSIYLRLIKVYLAWQIIRITGLMFLNLWLLNIHAYIEITSLLNIFDNSSVSTLLLEY